MVIISDIGSATRDIRYHSIVWEFLQDQRKQQINCDVKILCNGKNYFAHSIVLTAVSQYFRAFLSGMYSKRIEENITCVDLTCFSANCIKLLLDILYEEELESPSDVDLIEFMQAVDFIQLQHCEDLVYSLFRSKVNLENCLDLYHACRQFRSKKLKKFVVALIDSNFPQISHSKEWKKMEKDKKVDIILDPFICHHVKDLSRDNEICSEDTLKLIQKNLLHIDSLITSLNANRSFVIHSTYHSNWEKAIALKDGNIMQVNEKMFPMFIDKRLMPGECVFFVYKNGLYVASMESTQIDFNHEFSIRKYDPLTQKHVRCNVRNSMNHLIRLVSKVEYLFQQSPSIFYAVVRDCLQNVHVITFDMKTVIIVESFNVSLEPLQSKEWHCVYNSSTNLIYIISEAALVTIAPLSNDVEVFNYSKRVNQPLNKTYACLGEALYQFHFLGITTKLFLFVSRLDESTHAWIPFSESELNCDVKKMKAYVLDGKLFLLTSCQTKVPLYKEEAKEEPLYQHKLHLYDTKEKVMGEVAVFSGIQLNMNMFSLPSYLLELD